MEKSQSKKLILVGLLVVLLIAGGVFLALASSDDEESNNNSQATAPALPLNLQVDLATLEQGVYEGWVVQGEDKLSFGTFNTNAEGAIVGDLDLGDIVVNDGDTVAISIEPENDTDPAPSQTIVLAGSVQNGAAELTFPLEVGTFAGQYILATPTTATIDDETAGVWFTTTGSDASLDIPVAPEGWAYEGWVVVDGTPLSTGVFTDPAAADMFNGFSGPDSAPNKPGEDFVANLPEGFTAPLDLRGMTVVVSIEPYQDGVDPTGPAPAQVKPLSAEIATDATDHTTYDLIVSEGSVPFGSISL